MSRYIKRSLGEGERVEIVGRFPTVFWIGAWATLIVLGPFLIGVYFFARWAVYMKSTFAVVTNQRVILKRGLIRRWTEELAVDSIESVELDQSVLGRLFGYGTITVHGTGEASIELPPVAHAVAFRRALQTSHERHMAEVRTLAA